jgi:WD40 repeat protein
MFVLAGLLASAPSAAACGISWILPSTPFMGNEDYRFQLAEKWGEVKISEKRTIPIHVTFSPLGDRVSPILGRDWQFALFDSTCILSSDNAYLMRLPDGNAVRLGKTKNASVWTGDGWVAQVSGRVITVKSSCGWMLAYNLGRLQQLKTPEGDILDFITDLGKGTRTLNANGKPVLTLRPDFDKTTTQKFWHLNFSGKHALLKMGKRPFLVKIRDYKTNKPIDRKTEIDTLVSMKFDGGMEKQYSFSENEMTFLGCLYQWDKSSKELVQKGEEKYSFVSIKGVKCLKTTFPDGSSSLLGGGDKKSIYKSRNGAIKLTEFIESPSADRKSLTRRIMQIDERGQEIQLSRFWYDDKGELIRKWTKHGDAGLIYEKKGQIFTIKDALTGNRLSERKFDDKGRLIFLKVKEKEYEFSFPDEKSVRVIIRQGLERTEKNVALEQFNSITSRFEF